MVNNKILIVEDEAILAADLSERLEKAGYPVIGTASNGEQALDLSVNKSPDLVLMDIKIQGDMDGIDTARKIGAKCGTPIIYLTAFSNKSLLEKAKITEPFGYLVKPVNDSQLFSSIEMTIFKAKMTTERVQLTKKLQEALVKIKTLRGILPICSHCKKIRDDQGYWNSIEKYIHEHSEAELSHGICPECADKYYPDMDLYGDNQI